MPNQDILLEIKDTDFNPTYSMSDISHYDLRESSRGLVINGNTLALLYVSNFNYFKLPGGGIEKDENIEIAFTRETLEEVGCKVKDVKIFGKIIEYRDQFKLKQISYVLTGKVDGEIGPTNLEQSEIDEGFELKWIPIDKAIGIMQSSKPTNYEGQFIVKRDLFILRHCLPLN